MKVAKHSDVKNRRGASAGDRRAGGSGKKEGLAVVMNTRAKIIKTIFVVLPPFFHVVLG